MPDLLLEDLKLHIENMYDQLDSDRIDEWPVDGLEVWANGKTYRILVETV